MVASSQSLAEEVRELRAQLSSRDEALTTQMKLLAGKDDQLANKDAKITHLQELLYQALHREFGASSEKASAEQARLFDELDGNDDDAPETSAEPIRVENHERKKRGRARLSADLPRIEVIHDLPDDEKICSKHGCELIRPENSRHLLW